MSPDNTAEFTPQEACDDEVIFPTRSADIPFAAPLMAGALLAFTISFVVLKLLDRFLIQKSAGSRTDTK